MLEISSKDYRAWFGLGQTYELLRMPHYAIFYLQKAAALKYLFMHISNAM